MANDFSFDVDATKRSLAAASEPGGGAAIRVAEPQRQLRLGRYTIESVLGTGGFGIVYAAHDTQLERRVAIKVIKNNQAVPQSYIDAFLEEARRLARLNHRGIVAIHDVGTHEGMVYLVSDFLDGPDLHSWLKTNRPDWKFSSHVIAEVADALAHAHSRKTVHRDIKPANILLTGELQPVLVDFGIGLDESHAGGSVLGMVTGTPRYMSPEQAEGKAHRIDGRTDIYSLGVVLYEMLCGEAPFRSGSVPEILRQVREDEPQPLRQLRPQLPEPLEAICLKAMAKDVQKRYTTASDFAQELRAVIQSGIYPTGTGHIYIPTTPVPSSATAETVKPITPTRSGITRSAERRQLTLLSCNCELFAGAYYLESLEAEEQAAVVQHFTETAESIVRKFDGSILQCNDSGLLACFGYPIALEDAARRALLVGLELVRKLGVTRLPLLASEITFGPAVIVHTGYGIAESKEAGLAIVGEVRNVINRIVSHGETGKVICTGTAHKLAAATCSSKSLGARSYSETAAPVEMFEVDSVMDATSAAESKEPASLTPLVGRDHEVSMLQHCWERVQEGEASVVLIIGEAGLGKSRLVHSLKQHVSGSQDSTSASSAAQVIEWRCSAYHQNSPLQPAIDCFDRSLKLSTIHDNAEKCGMLQQHLAKLGVDKQKHLPMLAALLAIDVPAAFARPEMSPARLREETLTSLEAWFYAQSRGGVLFIVEDLHWADATTLEFLRRFLIDSSQDGILALLTFRPEFKTPWPAAAHQTNIPLHRLTRQQVAAISKAQLKDDQLPASLVEQIYERTSGIPLFLEEFVKLLRDSGALDRVEDDSTQIRNLLAREIPASLQDLVMARLDRMDGDREVVQLAATLGREFRHELIAAVSTMDLASLVTELSKLVRGEILQQKGQPPSCTYAFRHALLQDAVRNSLTRSKKQSMHERIGKVIEDQFPDIIQAQPELVAYHYSESANLEKAVKYCLVAGLHARSRSAEAEAIGHLERGLDLMKQLPATAQRDVKELQILGPLGTAYIASRGYAAPEVGPNFARARELCEQIGDSHQLFAVLWGTWVWNLVRGDLKSAMEMAGPAMELAERMEDKGMIMEALFLPAVVHAFRGEFQDAFNTCDRALQNDNRDRTRFWAAVTGEDAGVAHRCYKAVALWHIGRCEESLQLMEEALSLARKIAQPFTLAFALEHRAWLSLHCRLPELTLATVEEEIAIATEQGFAYWLASAQLFKADALVLQGKSAEAIPLLKTGIDNLRKTGANLDVTLHYAFLGFALLQTGKHKEALDTCDEGLSIAAASGERFFESEFYRIKAQVQIAAESPAAAEALLKMAIDCARSSNRKMLELRAAVSLAQLWSGKGNKSDARNLLAPIPGGLKQVEGIPDFEDAAALLRDLS